MATRDFVPRADGEGSIGTAIKAWGKGYFKGLELPDDGKKDLMNELVGAFLGHSAGSHNALFRGKDLTSYFDSGEMSEAIAAGTFDDIFPGDFIKKSLTVDGAAVNNIEFVIGDLDYHLHRGDQETVKHHVLIFPRTYLGKARMNAENKTDGGYLSSEMWTTTIPKYAAAIQAAFGSDHILSHRELLTKTTSATGASAAGAGWAGTATNWEWTTVIANLFNEPMVYGNHPASSSMFDIGDCNTQVAAMRHDKSLSFTRAAWCWLRAVASASDFAYADGHGAAHNNGASVADGGVRPYSLLT